MVKTILTLLILLPLFCLPQKQGNIWYFGDHAGLDFSSGDPVTITDGQLTAEEGTAVICDNSGALLFYTNGFQIWNKNHQVMPNGDSLQGSVSLSSSQAALIIPQPGSSRFFYVFTTDDVQHNLQYGLRYSIVDICLDNGLGDVIGGKKNRLLLDTVAEKLTAVRHANGLDYWIITHKYFSDAFYAYHLNSTGITDTVISHIGSVHPTGLQNTGAAIGQLKASPNGKKLATVNCNSSNNIAEYFDFNKTTGLVSNCVNIQWDTNYHYYGVSFSPDNSKLYIGGILNFNGIFQFDLTAGGGDPNAVKASRYVVTSVPNNYFALQLANNGKIYGAHTPFTPGNPFLSVINNPNVAGGGCNYVDNFVDLNGRVSYYGLPNFVDSYDYSNKQFNCMTDTAVEETKFVFPNAFTPNGDRQNDKFYPVLQQGASVLQFHIYNRWGQLVYNNFNAGWDGTFEDKEQPSDTYFYYAVIKIEDINSVDLPKTVNVSGAFSLLR